MNKQEQVQQMTTYMANFVSHIAKVLPDDIIKKLDELGAQEDAPLSKVIYETMKRNQKLAKELNRPSCQDTGVLQFWVKCGVDFPLIGEVEGLLKEAVVKSTFEAPLRHNSVETFDEFNTGLNVGKGTPTVWWDIIPNSDKCEIYAYMAGGGCTLPGKAMVLMPGAGYEGVTKFVMDVMTSYGINACPPLLVGVGVATSVVQEGSDASSGQPQRERARSLYGEAAGGRHQLHRPWPSGHGRQVLRHGRAH